VRAIKRAGYRIAVAKTFEAAKGLLASGPDLLITELKLGEYNGLQLALRGRPAGIPTLVIADKTFEHDVEQVGAVWVADHRLDGDDVVAMMPQLLRQAPREDAFEMAPASALPFFHREFSIH
jgi:DNA-binding response OmpR family regulator